MLTVQQIEEGIKTFEYEFGESFTDRFLHDNVSVRIWIGFLFGMGYYWRANYLVKQLLTDDYICQEALFYINSSTLLVTEDKTEYFVDLTDEDLDERVTQEDQDRLYDKDVSLWAVFLGISEHHNKLVETFFEKSGIKI